MAFRLSSLHWNWIFFCCSRFNFYNIPRTVLAFHARLGRWFSTIKVIHQRSVGHGTHSISISIFKPINFRSLVVMLRWHGADVELTQARFIDALFFILNKWVLFSFWQQNGAKLEQELDRWHINWYDRVQSEQARRKWNILLVEILSRRGRWNQRKWLKNRFSLIFFIGRSIFIFLFPSAFHSRLSQSVCDRATCV